MRIALPTHIPSQGMPESQQHSIRPASVVIVHATSVRSNPRLSVNPTPCCCAEPRKPRNLIIMDTVVLGITHMHYTKEPRLCSLCYLCHLSRASFIFAFSTRKRHRLEWMHLVTFELVQGVLSTIHGRLLVQVLLIPIVHRISSTRNASSPRINSPSIQQAQIHIPRNSTCRLKSISLRISTAFSEGETTRETYGTRYASGMRLKLTACARGQTFQLEIRAAVGIVSMRREGWGRRDER